MVLSGLRPAAATALSNAFAGACSGFEVSSLQQVRSMVYAFPPEKDKNPPLPPSPDSPSYVKPVRAIKREAIDEELLPTLDVDNFPSDLDEGGSDADNALDHELNMLLQGTSVESAEVLATKELARLAMRCPAPRFNQSFPVLVHPRLRRDARAFLPTAASAEAFSVLRQCVQRAVDPELLDLVTERARAAGFKLDQSFFAPILVAFSQSQLSAAASKVSALLNASATSWTAESALANVAFLEAFGKGDAALEAFQAALAKGTVSPLVDATEASRNAWRLATDLRGGYEAGAGKGTAHVLQLGDFPAEAARVALRHYAAELARGGDAGAIRLPAGRLVVQTRATVAGGRAPLDEHQTGAALRQALVSYFKSKRFQSLRTLTPVLDKHSSYVFALANARDPVPKDAEAA